MKKYIIYILTIYILSIYTIIKLYNEPSLNNINIFQIKKNTSVNNTNIYGIKNSPIISDIFDNNINNLKNIIIPSEKKYKKISNYENFNYINNYDKGIVKNEEINNTDIKSKIIRLLESFYDDTFIKIKKIQLIFIIIERNRSLEFDILRSLLIQKPYLCNNIEVKIVHAEQSKNGLFNRGLLANIGFLESVKIWKFDNETRIIIHDTDMFPESNMCYNNHIFAPIVHHASRATQFNDKKPYSTYFGGIVSFHPDTYKKINGFSNKFWGWGGEDDDLYRRVNKYGYSITSSTSGRLLSTCHERDKSNINENTKLLENETYDGLNNCEEIVTSITTIINSNEIHTIVAVKDIYLKYKNVNDIYSMYNNTNNIKKYINSPKKNPLFTFLRKGKKVK